MAALEETEKSGGQKVKPILLSTFVQKATRKTSATEKLSASYKEEREVIRDLCFAENWDEEEKIECFGHEWTSYPSSLFEPCACTTP